MRTYREYHRPFWQRIFVDSSGLLKFRWIVIAFLAVIALLIGTVLAIEKAACGRTATQFNAKEHHYDVIAGCFLTNDRGITYHKDKVRHDEAFNR